MMKKSNMKIIYNKKLVAYALMAVLLTGITGCGTRLNGEGAKESTYGQKVTEGTEQMLTEQIATEQASTDKYLDMAGATEADYSKYEKSSTEEQAQSTTHSGTTTSDTSNGITFDATKGSSAGDNAGNNAENSAGKNAGNTEENKSNTSSSNDNKSEYTCTLTVTCATVLDHMKDLSVGKESLIPSDGIIYSKQKVTFSKGETVFDVLQREMKANRIQMEFTSAPAYNCDYVESIDNLYEFDCGQNSGWKYSVNGEFPSYGCSQYQLKDQDVIQWAYTCDLGKDLEK